MAHYAVGDIQGCLSHLKQLLDKADFNQSDILWCAGDLVNRGPESLNTLRFVKSLGERAIVVLGNHDLHLLACWAGVRTQTKKDTFDETLNAPDLNELMHWLIQKPLFYRDTSLGYAMVHAGIPPIWDLKTAEVYAKEVEAILRSGNPEQLFKHMYGNEPAGWRDKMDDTSRLRVITNYFTRMRFCTEEGDLEFASKCGPESPPNGYLPWFQHAQHRCLAEQDKLIFGHWAALRGNSGNRHFIGLDTGCVWGGALTMMRLEDGELFCLDCVL